MMPEKSRILIVDDNEEFCQNLTDILELRGHEVVTAFNGFKALQQLQKGNYEAVLMDIKMPQMDGVRTLKNVQEIAPDTPVIMVTAHADEIFNLAVQATKGTLIIMRSEDQNAGAHMRHVLGQQGYLVDVISNTDAAVDRVKTQDLDIIILDLRLGSLNTLETYLTIRELRPDIVVVIIVKHQQVLNELAQQALQHIVYAFLQKPINIDELVSLLERIENDKNRGLLRKPDESSQRIRPR